MLHYLLTGSNGFVGRALGHALVEVGETVTGLSRRGGSAAGVAEWIDGTPDFAGLAHRLPAGFRCDCVIHLAARVHMMVETEADSMAAYRATNVAGSLEVAKAAVAAGARRMVFVSSVKALGEFELGGRPWKETDQPEPSDPYGISKLEAERALFEFGRAHALEIVVVRPPLVYGPEVRANFRQMMQAVSRGMPLPLGAVTASRSMLYVGNLASALIFASTSAGANGQVLHVSDGEDVNVPELLRRLGVQLGRPARLIAVPVGVLRAVGALTGKSGAVRRLVLSLRLDTSRITHELGWRPPFSVDQGLADTVAWFRSVR